VLADTAIRGQDLDQAKAELRSLHRLLHN